MSLNCDFFQYCVVDLDAYSSQLFAGVLCHDMSLWVSEMFKGRFNHKRQVKCVLNNRSIHHPFLFKTHFFNVPVVFVPNVKPFANRNGLTYQGWSSPVPPWLSRRRPAFCGCWMKRRWSTTSAWTIGCLGHWLGDVQKLCTVPCPVKMTLVFILSHGLKWLIRKCLTQLSI